MKVSLSKVKANPFNERQTVEKETLNGLDKLTKQMKKRGWWGSLLVRKSGNKYEAAFGSLRLKSANAAGIKEIDVEIQDLSDKEMKELTVIENVHRQEVNPVDRAKHLNSYMKKYRATYREMENLFGIPRASLEDLITLTKMSAVGQKLVKNRKIGPRKAQIAYDLGGDKMVKVASKEKEWRKTDLEDMKTAVNKLQPKKREQIIDQVIEGDIEPWEVPTKAMGQIRPSSSKPMDTAKMVAKLERKIKEAKEAIKVSKAQWHHFSGSEQMILSLRIGSLDKEIHKMAKDVYGNDVEKAINMKALHAAR